MSTAEQIIAEALVQWSLEPCCRTCAGGLAAHVVAALTNAGKTIVEQSAAVEALLDTRAGLLVAHNAWHEGLSAGISACNAEGPWRKPESPYFAPWAAARVAEGGERGE